MRETNTSRRIVGDRDPRAVANPAYARLGRELENFERRSCISAIAGLLTVPEYQPQTMRLEMLLYLACLHCRGTQRPTRRELARWIERELGGAIVKSLEDPPEDVFVTNIIGPRGNYRFLDGVWETGDFYIEQILEVIRQAMAAFQNEETRPPLESLLESIEALLSLSEALVDRTALPRWTSTIDPAPSRDFLARAEVPLQELTARVTFTPEDLRVSKIDPDLLTGFVLTPERESRLAIEAHGNTSLERYPLLRFGDALVFAFPTATSSAIRRFTLDWVAEYWNLDEFSRFLAAVQARSLLDGALARVGEAPDHLAAGWPEGTDRLRPLRKADIGLCSIDRDKVGIIILQHDSLRSIRIRGLLSTGVVDQRDEEATDAWLNDVIRLFGPAVKGGLVLFVPGGLGRGRLMRAQVLPSGWHADGISLPDFESFAWADGSSLLRLWKLLEEVQRLEHDHVFIPVKHSLLNLYAYWEARRFTLVPPGQAYPSPGHTLIDIGPSNALPFRVRERRRNDLHAAPFDAEGSPVSVRRLHRDPFFKELAMQPVYRATDYIESNEVAGLIEGGRCVVWVEASRRPQSREAGVFYLKIWESLLDWINRVLPAVEDRLPAGYLPPLHVRLYPGSPERWDQFPVGAGDAAAETPTATVDANNGCVWIELPFGFLTLIRRPENDAERALLGCACEGLLQLIREIGVVPQEINVQEMVDAVMPTADERSLHIFDAPLPAVYLAMASGREPRFIALEDRSALELGLGWEVLGTGPRNREHVIAGRTECVTALNRLVDLLWSRIRHRLKDLDATSVIRMACENSEDLHGDREQWRRTARALFALHGGAQDVISVAGMREGRRAIANQAARVLVEMALPTCPEGGGRIAAWSDFDFLTSAIVALLQAAAASDAIRGGVAEAQLTVRPDGRVETDQAFMSDVTTPFVLGSFAADYRSAAAEYEELFTAPGERTGSSPGSVDDPEFVAAFESEFSLAPLQMLHAAAELMDLALRSGRSVPVPTRAEIGERLRKNRGFSDAEVSHFFEIFALPRRDAWDETPAGFTRRDWQPWHFRRRLSLVSRPLIVMGESDAAPVLFGAYQVGASASYVLSAVELGWYINTTFRSREMRKYQGSVVERLGHRFTQEVAAALGADGWHVHTEVQMRTLGAPKALGDVDVCAWHDGDPRLLLIECKRLQPARNVGEIVELLNQFRGAAGDRLGKHLARSEWIADNFEKVRLALKLPSEVEQGVPYLVTNAEVPMRYTRGLGLAPDQFLSFRELNTRLRPMASRA